ncbi:hypothetical protein Tco_1439524, partial [Tanacetum coccineum]
MLQIYPKLPGQKFKDPPFEEEIQSFIRDLGHTGKIKVLSDVNVNHIHQPWRSFAAIINKFLSEKTTALESLRLSRAQILWGRHQNQKPQRSLQDKGLTVLSDVALTEVEQLKLVIERSKTQTHSSHASGSGANEGTGGIPRVLDVPTYGSDDEQISWKSSEEDDEDEVKVNENDDDNDNNDDDDDADNQDDDDDEQTDS